jgi:hypothetical protein
MDSLAWREYSVCWACARADAAAVHTESGFRCRSAAMGQGAAGEAGSATQEANAAAGTESGREEVETGLESGGGADDRAGEALGEGLEAAEEPCRRWARTLCRASATRARDAAVRASSLSSVAVGRVLTSVDSGSAMNSEPSEVIMNEGEGRAGIEGNGVV